MSSSAVATPAGGVRSQTSSQTGASAVSKDPAQGRTRWVWLRAAGGGAAALALLAGANALYRGSLASPYFRVREVRVSGTVHLSRSVVKARLRLRRTDNLLAADLETLRLRIESHPWVRSASLSRDLPDVLRVEVVERKPWAVWIPTGNRGRGARLIDAESVILAEGRAEAGGGGGWKGLPVLRGLDVSGAPKPLRAGRPLSGKTIETGLAAIRAYLAVWPPGRKGGVRLAAVDLSGHPGKERISMNLLGSRGRTVWVRLSPRDMEQGLRRFAFLLERRGGKPWPGKADLSMGSRVVVRSSARRPKRYKK